MNLFDLHCDTLTECEKHGYSLLSNPLHWDFQRVKSMFDTAFQVTAIYIQDNTNEQDAWDYFQRVLSFFDTQSVPLLRTAEDMRRFQHGVFLAVENGNVIGRDLEKLSVLADVGIVYITVTWNGANLLGNGCLSGCDDGLTPLGKAAVDEMYRVGILPDVSHLNPAGFWDVATLASGRPFLASHSVSHAVHAHPRNLTDAQFCAVRESGGLVGLNICADQLGKQDFEQLERHLAHFWELDGVETVALGLDLDGTELINWNDIAFVSRFYEYLLCKGYPETAINALFFENSQCFFTKTLTSRQKCIRIGT